MELLVCMSIAGSIPVVICLLLYIIQRDNYNYILGRRLLLTGLFFYLVPVQLVKYLIPEKAYPEVLFNEETQLYLSNSLSFWHERQGEYVWIPQWFNIVAVLWLIGVIIFSLYEVIKYLKETRYIRDFIFEKVEDTENNLTYYLIPDGICGPCTIGFFHQKIAIPESFPLHPDFVMVYKHEYAHLRHHDNFVKLLCLLVRCLHWMNPIAYLLFYLYSDTAEIVSDGAAVDGCTKEKRRDYARLLVLEASTALAYEAMPSSDESFSDVILDDSLNDFGDHSLNDDLIRSLDFSESDTIYIDSDGIQTTEDDLSSSYALCTHSMADSSFYTHAKNSSGGCTVKVYTCQKCKKCGYRANAVLYSTTTYAKCPH